MLCCDLFGYLWDPFLWFLQNLVRSLSDVNRRRSRAMRSALAAVEEGLLTVSSAARAFGLTQSAVYYQVKQHRLLHLVRRGVQPELTGQMKTRLTQLMASCKEHSASWCCRKQSGCKLIARCADVSEICSWLWAMGLWLWAMGVWLWAMGVWLWAMGVWLWAMGVWLWAMGVWLCANGVWLWAMGVWLWAMGVWLWAMGFFSLSKSISNVGVNSY